MCACFAVVVSSPACRSTGAGAAAREPWKPLSDLVGLPSNTVARVPSASVANDTVFLAANVHPASGNATPSQTLYLASFPGGPFPGPSGDRQFVFPKIVASPSGALHLVWAEFDSTRADVRTWLQLQSSLWHSSRKHGKWSPPERIASGSVQWLWEDGRLTVDDDGTVHVVVWVFNGRSRGLAHIHGSGGRWTIDPLPYVTSMANAAIASTGDSLWIAFSATDFREGVERLTLLHSVDRGPWQVFVVRSLPSDRRAIQPRFVRAGPVQYLVWAEARLNVTGIDTIRIARVIGDNTEVIASIGLPVGASMYAVAGTSCGTIAALVETFAIPPSMFELRVAVSGRTDLQPLLRTGSFAAFAGLAANTRDLLAVLTTGTDAEVRTVLTTRQACD
jgi:hypothetical protein